MLSLAPLSAAAAVRTFDEAGINEVTGSTSAAAIFVAPRGCERAPGTCKPLYPWWDAVGAAFPGVAWRLSCEEQRELCAEKSRLAVPRGVEPLFVFWTGNRFDRYRGNPSPVDLHERVREVALATTFSGVVGVLLLVEVRVPIQLPLWRCALGIRSARPSHPARDAAPPVRSLRTPSTSSCPARSTRRRCRSC